MKPIYRKVSPTQKGGEYYPFCNFNIIELVDFGLGISAYFLQLLLVAVWFSVAILIMIPSAIAFTNKSYGISSRNMFLASSSACKPYVNVTATVGCHNASNNTCQAKYRPNCEIPLLVPLSTIIMIFFCLFAFFLTRYLERYLRAKLDEAIQTPQDYSVVVNDPNSDASDPHEWKEYFSRFGKVRYVTVVRNNYQLCTLLLQRNFILRRFGDSERIKFSSHTERVTHLISGKRPGLWTRILQRLGVGRDRDYNLLKLSAVNESLAKAIKLKYPVCKYV